MVTLQSKLHNRIVGEIVKSIVVPPLTSGGDFKDVMVVLESVVAGVVLAMFKLGGDNIVLDTVMENAKARVQEIMARDVYEHLHENIQSIVHAIEHMRGLQRHGGDFMMKRAFAGFAALPAPGSFTWWSVLMVEPGATSAEIQSAYRKLAAERHPDKPGGSQAMMAELNAARDQAMKDRV